MEKSHILLFAKFNFCKFGKFLHMLKSPSLDIELYDIFNSFIYGFFNLEINSLSKLLFTKDNFFVLILDKLINVFQSIIHLFTIKLFNSIFRFFVIGFNVSPLILFPLMSISLILQFLL